MFSTKDVIMYYLLIIIELLLFVTAVIIAVFSWRTSIKSLREAEKARRDTFLPIVYCIISGGMLSRESGTARIQIRNVGHGPAINVKVKIPLKEVQERKFLGTGEEFEFELQYKSTDVPISEILELTCFDIFGRKINYYVPLTVAINKEKLVHISLNMDSYALTLPG